MVEHPADDSASGTQQREALPAELTRAGEQALGRVQASAQRAPRTLRTDALRAADLAAELWIRGCSGDSPKHEQARTLATELMCASSRTMSGWAKQVGRTPLEHALMSRQPAATSTATNEGANA